MDHQPSNPSESAEQYYDTNTRSIYLGSSRLAHEHLVAQSQVVLRLGRILMKSGASAYRIKASMSRLAKAVGLKEHHAQVTFTEISTSSYTEGNFRTEVAEQRTMALTPTRLISWASSSPNCPNASPRRRRTPSWTASIRPSHCTPAGCWRWPPRWLVPGSRS